MPATRRTGVNEFELADDVEPHLRELVLEQMKEQRKEMLDGGIFAEERCQAADLVGKCSPNVLGDVLAQISDARYNPSEHNFFLKQFGKPWTIVKPQHRRLAVVKFVPGTCPAAAVLTSASLSLRS